MKSVLKIAIGLVLFTGLAVGFCGLIGARGASAQTEKESTSPLGSDGVDRNDAERMMKEGQETFRSDTFGDEAFWGDTLKLHQAIEGAKLGRRRAWGELGNSSRGGPESRCGRTSFQP
jgi:hypothetical protein